MSISSKEKKELARRRKEAARQAQKFHKEQEKRAKKSSSKSRKKPEEKPAKPSASKIEEAVNSGKTAKFQKLSREEKYRRESEEKIRNLKPQDFEDGYYIDEYSEKQRRERRARVIRRQETETIRRNKKPMTSRQVRVRRVLITTAILLSVIAIGVILSLTVLFKTEKIEVDGCSYYYDDQIISCSNVSLQQNIFIAKMNSTPEEIVRTFAYVEDAKIDFSIPDTITITITDAVPAYYMVEGNNYLLISAKGRVLERAEQKPDNLPELICGDISGTEIGSYIKFDDPAVPEILQSVAKSLSANEFTGIVGFDVTDSSEITLDYQGRIKINLGAAEDLDYKIRTAQAIITKKLDPNNTGQIYGNLDVSTCAKNKMSHYVPAATVPPSTRSTDPTGTTGPDGEIAGGDGIDYGYGYGWSDDSWDDGSWSWDGDDWSDDGGDTWQDDGLDDGGYYDDGGFDDGGYGGDAYDGEVPDY